MHQLCGWPEVTGSGFVPLADLRLGLVGFLSVFPHRLLQFFIQPWEQSIMVILSIEGLTKLRAPLAKGG